MISIGISDGCQVNDVGSPYLHKRNKVGLTRIGKSKVARAIVYDQHIIDKAYLQDLIDEKRHNCLNKYLQVIVVSGAFPTGVQAHKEKIFTSQYSFATPKGVALMGVQKFLVDECGTVVEKRLWKIMCDNPQDIDRLDLKVLEKSSNALMHYWFIGNHSPVSLFQQALTNPL